MRFKKRFKASQMTFDQVREIPYNRDIYRWKFEERL